jgi:hypothetical protein
MNLFINYEQRMTSSGIMVASLVKDLANYIYIIYKRLYPIPKLTVNVELYQYTSDVIDVNVELDNQIDGLSSTILLMTDYTISDKTLAPLYIDNGVITDNYNIEPIEGPYRGQISPELYNRIINEVMKKIDERLAT